VTEATYQFCGSLTGREQTFAVTDGTLTWPGGTLPLEQIASIRLYSVPGMRTVGYGIVARASRRCTIRLSDGHKIALSSQHFLGLGRFEDRSATYTPFVRALLGNLAVRCPQTPLFSGLPPGVWWSWFLTFAILAALLLAFVLFGGIGLAFDGQFTWSGAGVILGFAALATGPISYLRYLWRHRSHRLDPASDEI
jgi:hypothetical protein